MRSIKVLLAILLLTLVFTSCTEKTDPIKEAYDNASVSQGGINYDKFWAKESTFDQNSSQIAHLNANADFYRCKQCHGWDLIGSSGSYINRGPRATRPNISGLNLQQIADSKSYTDIFDAMKRTNGRRDISYDLSTYDPATNKSEGDKMPNYNQLLNDAQIWDLVKFFKEGAFDVTALYDATYEGTYPTGKYAFSNIGKDGDAAKGKAYYASNCAACHGSDGTKIVMDDMSAGQFTRKKAYEVHHKVKYGQLGSPMLGEFDITIDEMTDLYKALADVSAFPDIIK